MEFLNDTFAYILSVLLWGGVIYYWWNKNTIKGRKGERIVAQALMQLDPNEYKVLNDLLLPSVGHLPTTQVDHIVVSRYGIFCIETKNIKGFIYGNAFHTKWTQSIYGHKTKIYNPIHQNFVHVKSVEQLIDGVAPIISLVALPSAYKISIFGSNAVGSPSQIVEKIRSYKKVVISDGQCDKVVELLSQAHHIDKDARRDHVQNTRKHKAFRA